MHFALSWGVKMATMTQLLTLLSASSWKMRRCRQMKQNHVRPTETPNDFVQLRLDARMGLAMFFCFAKIVPMRFLLRTLMIDYRQFAFRTLLFVMLCGSGILAGYQVG